MMIPVIMLAAMAGACIGLMIGAMCAVSRNGRGN